MYRVRQTSHFKLTLLHDIRSVSRCLQVIANFNAITLQKFWHVVKDLPVNFQFSVHSSVIHSNDKEAALVTVLLSPPRFLWFYSMEHSCVVLRRCSNQNHVE